MFKIILSIFGLLFVLIIYNQIKHVDNEHQSNHDKNTLNIDKIQKKNQSTNKKYHRKSWPHWIDVDRDCQNTRAESLITASTIPVTFKRKKCCVVIHGKWLDPYTSNIFTQANKLDVDHLVPLKEAHISGGNIWKRKKRIEFANDPENLIVVSAKENKKKGAKDPAHWLPSTESYRCEYVKRWIYIKNKYNLSVDSREKIAINSILSSCI